MSDAQRTTLILKLLHKDTKQYQVQNFVESLVRNIAFQAFVRNDKFSDFQSYSKMAYLNFNSNDDATRAYDSISYAIQEAAKKGGPIFCHHAPHCFVTWQSSKKVPKTRNQRNYSISGSTGDSPTIFFNTLKAKEPVKKLLKFLNSNRTKNAIFISGTGSGKTTGIAIEALLSKQKVWIVLPKVIQVNLFVEFIQKLFPARNIGFAAGREVEYTLDGRCDMIVVTYGHFLRKIIFSKSQSQSRSIELADYLIVFDEVHESMGEIQAVLALSPIISNQKIITSATLDIESIQRSITTDYELFTHDSERKHKLTIEYSPIPDPTDRTQVVQHVIDVIKARLSAEKRILVFVPGLSPMDRIIAGLLSDNVVGESEVEGVHAEMWDDDIRDAVRSARIIVATNVLESSVTIEGVTLVIDTLLKNELADNCVLREVRISRAEADQRAGRAARTEDGRVVRFVSIEEYGDLQAFPAPPFVLNDPVQIYLALSMAYSTSDIQALLGIPDVQAARCRAELIRVGALDVETDGLVTPFGKKLLDVAVSLRFACPIAAAFCGNSCPSTERMFVLAVAAAFEVMTPLLYIVPRMIRLKGLEVSVMYAQQMCKDADLFGPSSVRTVLNILFGALSHPGNLQPVQDGSGNRGSSSNFLNKARLRAWCSQDSRCVNSKYVARALQLFVTLVQSHFPDSKPYVSVGALLKFPTLEALLRIWRPSRASTASQAEADALAERGLAVFERYFPDRYTYKGIAADFAHVTSPLEDDTPPRVVSAHGCFTEMVQNCASDVDSEGDRKSAAEASAFPPYSAAMHFLWRRRFGDEKQTLRITGIFKADHEPLFAAARARGAEHVQRRCRAAAELAGLAALDRGRRLLLNGGMANVLVSLTRPEPGERGASGQLALRQRTYAATAIARLTDDGKSSVEALVAAGACESLMKLLEDSGAVKGGADLEGAAEIRAAVARVARRVSSIGKAGEQALLSAGARHLVALASFRENDSNCDRENLLGSKVVGKDVLFDSIAAIEHLTAAGSIAVLDIVDAGGCEMLAKILSRLPAAARKRTAETLTLAARSASNLAQSCDMARQRLASSGVCTALIKLVTAWKGARSSVPGSVVEAAAGVLADLAKGPAMVKMALRQSGAEETLRALASQSTDAPLHAVESALIALNRLELYPPPSSDDDDDDDDNDSDHPFSVSHSAYSDLLSKSNFGSDSVMRHNLAIPMRPGLSGSNNSSDSDAKLSLSSQSEKEFADGAKPVAKLATTAAEPTTDLTCDEGDILFPPLTSIRACTATSETEHLPGTWKQPPKLSAAAPSIGTGTAGGRLQPNAKPIYAVSKLDLAALFVCLPVGHFIFLCCLLTLHLTLSIVLSSLKPFPCPFLAHFSLLSPLSLHFSPSPSPSSLPLPLALPIALPLALLVRP